MPQTLSKTLLGLEAAVLGYPVSMWLLAVFLPSLLFAPENILDWLGKLLAILIVAQLFAAYRVVFRFLTSGASGLGLMNPTWWWLCGSGVLVALGGAFVIAFDIDIGSRGDMLDFIARTAAFGILYLIPLGHILLELKFRRAVPHVA